MCPLRRPRARRPARDRTRSRDHLFSWSENAACPQIAFCRHLHGTPCTSRIRHIRMRRQAQRAPFCLRPTHTRSASRAAPRLEAIALSLHRSCLSPGDLGARAQVPARELNQDPPGSIYFVSNDSEDTSRRMDAVQRAWAESETAMEGME